MISRFKWYAVRFPTPLTEIFKKLENYRYSESQLRGFVVDASTSSFEFFWPTPVYATSIDESGQSSRNEFQSVSRQQVNILIGKKVILRMQDPPRSSKELFNVLEDLMGFGFVCEQIPVTDQIIRRAISGFHSATLNSVKFSGGLPKMMAIARIELASKNGLEQGRIEEFGLHGLVVESASYFVKYKALSGQVGFTRTGICKISGDLAPLIQSRVERCMMESTR